MSFRPLVFLGGSCIVAFAFAIYAFAAGAGFLAAFLIYSLGGSALLVAFSTISFIRYEQQGAGFGGQDHLPALGNLQSA